MCLPDRFQDHGKPEGMYEEAGLDAQGIVRTVSQVLSSHMLEEQA